MSRKRRRAPGTDGSRPTPSAPAPAESLPRAYRLYAVAVILAFVVPVLAPAVQNWRADPVDSFPLSYYPMFSFRRDNTRTELYFLGVEADGTRHALDLGYVFPGGMNQGRKQLRKAVEGGAEASQALAELLARRVALADFPKDRAIATVHVVHGKYELDRYCRGDRRPVGESSLGEARVPWGDR